MKRRHGPFFSACLFAIALPAAAHHSGSMFDDEKVIELEGTVKALQWTNPHIWLQVVVEADGSATEWSLEGGSPNSLSRQGWRSTTFGPGDVVMCPDPAYPIHQYAVIIAGGDLRKVPLAPDTDFIANLEQAIQRTWPKPKALIVSFPANPTTQVVDRAFFQRVVDFAREHEIMVIHDFAYAEIAFDGYQPPSILEVPGAPRIGASPRHLSAGCQSEIRPSRASRAVSSRRQPNMLPSNSLHSNASLGSMSLTLRSLSTFFSRASQSRASSSPPSSSTRPKALACRPVTTRPSEMVFT